MSVAVIDPEVSGALTDALADALSAGKGLAIFVVPTMIGALLFGKAIKTVPQYVGRLFSKAKG